jgi:hypothetical protein
MTEDRDLLRFREAVSFEDTAPVSPAIEPAEVRGQPVKLRTMQINGLRALLTAYGEVMGKDGAALYKAI